LSFTIKGAPPAQDWTRSEETEADPLSGLEKVAEAEVFPFVLMVAYEPCTDCLNDEMADAEPLA
jgi:hypothetical protein